MGNKLMQRYMDYYVAWRKAKKTRNTYGMTFGCAVVIFIIGHINYDQPTQFVSLMVGIFSTIGFYLESSNAKDLFESMLIVEDQIIAGEEQ